MADDLFSPAPSDSPHASGSAPASPTSANNDNTAPTPGPSAAAAAGAFVPRAVKRKAPVKRVGAAGVLAAQAAAARGGGAGGNGTSRPAAALPPSTLQTTPSPSIAAPAPAPKKEEKLSASERDRLEMILQAVEAALSDWGLSNHGRTGGRGQDVEMGLLDMLERGQGWVHLSQVVKIPVVRALTGSMGDVQKALKEVRESSVVQLDESGYKVGRRSSPDYERLRTMDLTEWDDCVVYLENIPYLPSLDSHSLPLFLSSLSASSSYPQKVILPPLFDKENPPSLSPSDDESESAAPTQAELFAQSRRASEGVEGKKARSLPKGGGPFKGFAFVVWGSKEEAERMVEELKWERGEGMGEAEMLQDAKMAEDAEGDEEDEEMKDGEEAKVESEAQKTKIAKGKGKEKKRQLSPAERARRSGMRALSYTRYLALKNEFLTYRRQLETLLDAQQSGELERIRNPPTRDRPPHLAQRDQQAAPPSSVAPSTGRKQHGKRAVSPTSPLFDNAALPPSSSSTIDAPPPKKRKRASSPTGGANAPYDPLAQRIARLPTPPPAVDLSSSSALSIRGAFPELCVLWVRNVHEKSTKTSLKALFGALLEALQEGSGKGVEFVDYEKGTEMCYLRFSSSALATLVLSHLAQTPSLHESQTSLTPLSSDPENADHRRPVVAELLTGEQERRYWAAVPEATRKKARETAGGRVGLLKEPKAHGAGGAEEEEEDRPPVLPTRNKDGKILYTAWVEEQEEKPDLGHGGETQFGGKKKVVEEEKPKKRKKPSRL